MAENSTDAGGKVGKRSRTGKIRILLGVLAGFAVGLGFFFFYPWDVLPPVVPELDYHHPQLAPEKNGFTYFDEAWKKLVDNLPPAKGAKERCSFNDLLSLSQSWNQQLAQEFLAANDPIFPLLDKGLACQRSVFPESPDSKSQLFSLQKSKVTVQLLGIKSRVARDAGDFAGALDAAAKGFRFSQMNTADANGTLELLVGMACQHISLESMQELVRDDRISDATLQKIAKLLAAWDRQGLENGYRQAIRANYQYTIDALRNKPEEIEPFAKRAKDFSPYGFKFNMTQRLFAGFYQPFVTAVDSGCYRQIAIPGKDELTELVAKHGLETDMSEMLLSFGKATGYDEKKKMFSFFPNLAGELLAGRYIQLMPGPAMMRKHFELLGKVQAMRALTACRLYEKKHGKLPGALDALIPEFLNAVPVDPFDGKPLRYDRQRGFIYSVGYDQKDDGGAPKYPDNPAWTTQKGSDLIMPIRPVKSKGTN